MNKSVWNFSPILPFTRGRIVSTHILSPSFFVGKAKRKTRTDRKCKKQCIDLFLSDFRIHSYPKYSFWDDFHVILLQIDYYSSIVLFHRISYHWREKWTILFISSLSPSMLFPIRFRFCPMFVTLVAIYSGFLPFSPFTWFWNTNSNFSLGFTIEISCHQYCIRWVVAIFMFGIRRNMILQNSIHIGF